MLNLASVRCLSGRTRQQVWSVPASTGGNAEPRPKLALAGDVDNDGVGDVLVGEARVASGLGRVQVLSGRNGSTLRIIAAIQQRLSRVRVTG